MAGYNTSGNATSIQGPSTLLAGKGSFSELFWHTNSYFKDRKHVEITNLGW
jgi:hypothetical protein